MSDVLVFDLDDTLYPERDYVISGFKAVSDWLINNKSVVGFFELSQQLFNEGERGNIFNLALDQLNVAYDTQRDIMTLVQVYRKHKPNITLFDDSIWAIDFYNYKKLAIITDGYYEAQLNKVKALNIGDKFSAIIYTDKFGRDSWKPSHFSFNRVMELFACKGEDCTYIADNPTKDFIGANELGWNTIHIARENGEYRDLSVGKQYQADVVINTLYDLKELIQ